MAKPRDYDKEYDDYHSQPDQIKKRAVRNSARSTMAKAGKVSKGDGVEVDHITPLKKGGDNAPSNLRVVDKKKNRGWRKGKTDYNI